MILPEPQTLVSRTGIGTLPAFRCGQVRLWLPPEDIIDYDDGPCGPAWGYDWRAHLLADATAWALALGSVAALGWLTVAGPVAPF